MARPKKAEEDKKHVLNIRVSYSTKNEVEAAANREGIPVSHKAEQLINAMLDLSDDADEETIDLLSDIVQEIQTVQSLTGGRWHDDLKTWAAVTEIFKGSPIRKKKPSSQSDDPEVQKAWREHMVIEREKQSLIALMQKFGISIEQVAKTDSPVAGRSIFSGMKLFDNRIVEEKKIAEIADPEDRKKAEAIFSMILDADERSKAAEDEWAELVKPYWKIQREGSQIYRDYRREVALDILSKGGFPDIEDL
tara:strand:- start:71 stop:820 length:750 start_codon:yes stop_codon:yes gene_type:complete